MDKIEKTGIVIIAIFTMLSAFGISKIYEGLNQLTAIQSESRDALNCMAWNDIANCQ